VDASTILAFGDVDYFFSTGYFDVYFSLGITLAWFTVTFSGELDFWKPFLRISISTPLLVNSDVFLAARMAVTVFVVDSDLFFLVDGTILTVRGRGGEGVSRFGIFPSDARSSWKSGFSFYSDPSSLCGSVAPIRRREDTERDRDSGVKVQID
jgi:hypothetical protein